MESKEIHNKNDGYRDCYISPLAGWRRSVSVVWTLRQACSGSANTASRLKTEFALWSSAHYSASFCWEQFIVHTACPWEYVILRVGHSTHICSDSPRAEVLDHAWVLLTAVRCLWHRHPWDLHTDVEVTTTHAHLLLPCCIDVGEV